MSAQKKFTHSDSCVPSSSSSKSNVDNDDSSVTDYASIKYDSNDKGLPEFSADDSVTHFAADRTLSKFRSIQLAPAPDEIHVFKQATFGKSADVSVNLGKTSFTSASEFANLQCPERPFSLMRTHFELDPTRMNSAKDGKSKFVKIVEAIDKCLKDFIGYDFSFFSEDGCMWKGRYLSGSSYCELHIHIYTQSPNPVYIVEANRVEGDSKPFFNFYRQFKSLLLNQPEESVTNNFFFAPLPTTKISDEHFLGGVQPIFTMAAEPFFESRLEAAKMLCDLSKHNERAKLQLDGCRAKVVDALDALVRDDFDLVKQHAMCAWTEFVDIPGYPDAMIKKSDALRALLMYAQTPAEPLYETIQARRECVRTLTALAKHSAAGSNLINVEADAIPTFQRNVAEMRDDKLRGLTEKLCTVLRTTGAAAAAAAALKGK